jgi:acetate---CoA ligase (ADP-forming)
LCAATVRLGQIMAAAAGELASVDVNPIIVGASGEALTIVDALVERVSLR